VSCDGYNRSATALKEDDVPILKISAVHKLGAGKRYGGWSPEPPSIKDWKFADSPQADTPMPTEDTPDRRALGQNGPVVDQGDLGSCVGHSSTYGVAYLTRVDKDAHHQNVYSRLEAYYDARTADGMQWKDVDSGAYIRDAMDSFRTKGIAPERVWKYDVKKFAKTPTKTVYKEAARWKLGAHWACDTVEDMIKAIAAGCALVGGITVYSSMMTQEVAQTGKVPMPKRNEEMEGGHALYFDRYSPSQKMFRFENSWSESWGDGGYGYISAEYLANRDLADDFWAMQAESPETTPWKD
jgi:C1A family cysteine protease